MLRRESKVTSFKTKDFRRNSSPSSPPVAALSMDQLKESVEMMSGCITECVSVHCDTDVYTFQDRILHHKCGVIKLVGAQMDMLNSMLEGEIEYLKKQCTRLGFLKKKKYYLLILLFLLLGMWVAFLYGTLLGAYICTGKSMKLCKICSLIVCLTPGLHWTQDTKNVF